MATDNPGILLRPEELGQDGIPGSGAVSFLLFIKV